MRSFLTTLILFLGLTTYAQQEQKAIQLAQVAEKPCKECEEIKAALRAEHNSQLHSGHHRAYRLKKWIRKGSGRIALKFKRHFSRTRPMKTTYEICFRWS